MKKKILTAAVSAVMIVAVTACGSKSSAVSPFSEATWDTGYEDLVSLEGTEEGSYESVYYGPAYTYARAYDGYDGLLKYMYDEDGNLMRITWEYSSDETKDAEEVYFHIEDQLIDKYGDTDYDADGSNSTGNYGKVWHTDGGSVIVSAMNNGTGITVQYSYFNPDSQITVKEE